MVGTVLCSGSGNFKWIIEDFLSVANIDTTITSPSFYFNNSACDLQMIMWESVMLQLSGSPGLPVKLGMNTGLNGAKETRSGRTNQFGCFVVEEWMSKSKFLQRSNKILFNGSLTVDCTLSAEQKNIPLELKLNEEEASDTKSPDQEIVLQNEDCTVKLVQDLQNLLTSEKDSDVTLKVQEKEYPAHKTILRMRSPVFQSMFSLDMIEKESKVVDLKDCNPDTFPDFLMYIYTGGTKHISVKNVFDLYTLSDKYCVSELKVECASFMKNKISVEIFCDVIALALQHDEKELIEAATDFFCSSTVEIVKTPKWQIFLRENPDVGNELFLKSFTRK